MTDYPQELIAFKDICPDVYTEVIEADWYKLHSLDFEPRFILDIGANFGCFSALAAMKWPLTRILSVEPHPPTFEELQRLTARFGNVTPINIGLGNGPLAVRLGIHPAIHSYREAELHRTEEPGYPLGRWDETAIQGESLDCLMRRLGADPTQTLIKIDIEGGEYSLINDARATEIISNTQYVVMEIHPWDYGHHDRRTDTLLYWLYKFSGTHDIEIKIVTLGQGQATLRIKPENKRRIYDFNAPYSTDKPHGFVA